MELRSVVVIFFVWALSSTPNIVKFSFGVVCSEREIKALVNFKKDLNDPSNQLSSWDGSAGNTDCCLWNGVVCNNKTDPSVVLQLRLRNLTLGGELNSFLLELKHLNHLDLSLNDFGDIAIPPFLGSLKNLRYLNLAKAGFRGMVPHQFGNLSSLRYLDITDNLFSIPGVESDLQWISHLSSLQYLDMSSVDLSKASSNWLHSINMLQSLVEVHLFNCNLGSIPSLFDVNLTSVEILDISGNDINSSIPEWLYNLSNIVQLDLSGCDFQGTISEAIGNMTSLTSLQLSMNQIKGEIPRALGNLCNLQRVSLGGNKLQGEISRFLGNSSGCIAGSLNYLNLVDNQLSGLLPDQLGRLKNLEYLSLMENSFSGSIPSSLGRLSLLQVLNLSRNKLNGSVPENLGNLSSLGLLVISYNAFEGVMTEAHFANLTSLIILELSSIVLKLNPPWVPPFQLTNAQFRNCQLGPRFPEWLRTQKYIRGLDLSSTGISGPVPAWFWNMSSQLAHLNLSYNQLNGELPSLAKPNSYLGQIDLRSNQLNGRLPQISTNVVELYLSNNSFSGPISSLLCNPVNGVYRLRVLYLSRNLLSGELSQCWFYWSSLQLIWLESNNITGKIPSSMGSLLALNSLHLQQNSLFGEIPPSLRECTQLMTIDLGENEFTGSIPAWMGESPRFLKFLRLRSNKFYGGIPKELCQLFSLQVLDLAHNNLSGPIPVCFGNFIAMTLMQNNRFLYSITYGIVVESTSLVVKGREVEYSNTLILVTSIDLSNNSLSGEIPKELTHLFGLRSLNLSENHFTGKIPNKIGWLSTLESLDFSKNRLSGLIPQSMANLTFLGHLNLSYNNLSGEIPSSTQLHGFTELSYMGNQGLCGHPVKNCNADEQSQGTDEDDDDEEDREAEDWLVMKWFYISLPLGFVVGFWGFLGVLVVKKSWRFAYFMFVEELIVKFCSCCSITKLDRL